MDRVLIMLISLVILVERRAALGHLLTDLPVAVHYRCVVAATDALPNAGQRELR